MAIKALAFLALSSICVMSTEQPVKRLPRFADYPASDTVTGKPARPQFRTSGQKHWEREIREGAGAKPNFGGTYTIVVWPCGTECMGLAVVDAKTGAIYPPHWQIAAGRLRCDRFDSVRVPGISERQSIVRVEECLSCWSGQALCDVLFRLGRDHFQGSGKSPGESPGNISSAPTVTALHLHR
jgi:hypothetical protein